MTLTGSFDPDPGTSEVWLDVMIRTSGTAPCNGPGSPGYTRTTLRKVMTHSRQTLVLPFAGQPLVLPPAPSGQPTCFGVTVMSVTNLLYTFAGASGYRFVG